MKHTNTKKLLKNTGVAIASLLLFFCVVQTTEAAAGINQEINLQGKLVNTDGTNIADGTYNMEFKIYQDGNGVPGGGDETLKWTEARLRNNSQGVVVDDGIFQVNLGSVTAFSGIDWNQSILWVSINVGNTNATCTPFSNCVGDGEMNPMIRFTAAPYAMHASTVIGFTPASGSLTLSGADAVTLTTTDTTALTLPTTGTLATLAGDETLSTKTLTAPKFVDLGFIADANGNEILVLDTVGSAVPYLQLSNNTTGLNPVITGAGETNTGIDFLTSGTGSLRVLGNATQAGEIRLFEDTTDGTNYSAFKVGIQSADLTYTLPTAYPGVTGYVLSATDAGVMSWVAAGGGSTLDSAYTAGNTIGTDSGSNVIINLADVATPTEVTINNLDASGTNALQIDNSTTLTNGLLVEQSAAGTLTNALQVLATAGTITNGLLIADGAGAITNGIQMTGTFTTTLLDTPSIDISGTGAITGATGVSTTTVTASSAIAANGGITFDQGTDTVGAFTAAGTILMDANIIENIGNTGTDFIATTGALTLAGILTANGGISIGTQALTGTTGNIDYTNFDVLGASGNMDTAGTITAGSGNVQVTDATGDVQHDSIVDCTDEQILKWQSGGAGWGCEADATGGGGGVTIKVKNADESLQSTTTLQNDNHLSFAVAASESWVFRFDLMTTVGNSSPDIKFGVTAPASPNSCLWYQDEAETAQAQSSIACGSGGTAIPMLPALDPVFVGGAIENGANAGSVQLQWAPNVAVASTTTVKRGSTLMAFKVQGADLAELYATKDASIEPGDVVSIDPDNGPIGVKKSIVPYDRNVIGIVSTQPGLALSDGRNLNGDRQLPIALAGRVPLKVNTENGEIRIGDYLTPSSTPGVAMKATKAGVIIGQAMTAHRAAYTTSVGTILAFVKTSFSNGSPPPLAAGLQPENDTGPSPNSRGKDLLAYVIQEKEALENKDGPLSEVFTDRLIAGLEIIAPKVMTQELATDIIRPSLTDSITIRLGPDGQIAIGEEGKTSTTTIDALGNATFAGVVTAKTIRADSIVGLEIYTDSVKSLEEKYAELAAGGFAASSVTTDTAPASDTEVVLETAPEIPQALTLKNVTVALDMSVLGKLSATGAVVIGGNTEFNGETLFNKIVTFVSETLFKGRVVFEQTPTFGNDTAGFAVISEGQKSVDIAFDEKYMSQPIVSVSITSDQSPLLDDADKDLKKDIEAVEADFNMAYFDGDIKYVVTKKSEKGFTIVLNKSAPRELQFSWVALAVSGAKTSYSKEEAAGDIFVSDTLAASQALGKSTPEDVPAVPIVEVSSVSATETAVVSAEEAVVAIVPPVSSPEPNISDIAPITDSLSQLTSNLGQ